jgi:hypothetical protein
MSKESCGNCKFLLGDRDRSGECRRNPPPVLNDDGEFQFPEMSIDDWCGEWLAKDATVASGKLYQLPNGQWITAADVSAVLAMDDKHRYCEDADGRFSIRVGVFFKDGCGNHIIPCNAIEAAEAMRDKIAADVNSMVGGV